MTDQPANAQKDAILAKALELGYQEADLFGLRGTGYFVLDQFELAKLDLDRAINSEPRYEWYMTRAAVHAALGDRNSSNKTDYYDKAVWDSQKAQELAFYKPHWDLQSRPRSSD